MNFIGLKIITVFFEAIYWRVISRTNEVHRSQVSALHGVAAMSLEFTILIKNMAEAAYRRGDLLEKRSQLM